MQSRRNDGFTEKSQNGKRLMTILKDYSSVQAPEENKDSSFRRTLLSDAMVKLRNYVCIYMEYTKWNCFSRAVEVAAAMHLLSLFAPFAFNLGAFWVAIGLYVITGLLGITLSFHRNLSRISLPIFHRNVSLS